MAKYSQGDVVVTFDLADGTTATNMSQYVQSIAGLDKEALMEQADTFGDSWVEHLPVGVRKFGEITIEGFYDDTATTGPDAVFGAVASSPTTTLRTLTVTLGSTKTVSVECFIKKYSRMLVRGKLHRYQVVLQSTGAVSEA